MSTIAMAVNGSRPRAVELARQAAGWLAARRHEVRLPKLDAVAAGLDALGTEPDRLAHGVDLFLALGGDGTMLRAVHLAVDGVAEASAPTHPAAADPVDVAAPVLGVNLGRLAYLSAIEPDGLCDALARFLDGDFAIEERSMLSLTVECSGEGSAPRATQLALNEAVLEHAGSGHTVHLALSIAGRRFTSHVADALIVATPTGSTAYAFSAGGPIVSPRHRALLVTPVAAHTPFTRSLVLHAEEPVRIEVLDHRGAVLSVDGQDVGRLRQGDAVNGEVAPVPARFVSFGDRDFYGVLKAKFGLADR